MTERILLGRRIDDGELMYLSKHTWDCDWYWGLGYLGNRNCHYHFESLLYNVMINGKNVQHPLASDLFKTTNITDSEWWIVRDLFAQAYALRKTAEVYRYGGHQSSRVGVTDIIKSAEKAKMLNADLENILDTLWTFVCKAVEDKPKLAV